MSHRGLGSKDPTPSMISDRLSGMDRPMRVLAISGSLRAGSSNTTVLRAARLLAPAAVEIILYDGVADLPAFNPDHDRPDTPLPSAASALRSAVAEADSLLISSPEYAHGIPGALKNLLDWLVGSTDFPGKPVALVATSPRSVFVQGQLAEVLRTMSARLVPDQPVMVPVSHDAGDAAAMATSPQVAGTLRRTLDALHRSVGVAASPHGHAAFSRTIR